jgi:hypothetical protein
MLFRGDSLFVKKRVGFLLGVYAKSVKLDRVTRCIYNELFTKPDILLILPRLDKRLRFLNSAHPTKGPSAVAYYLRTSLIHSRVRHRVVEWSGDEETIASLSSEACGRVQVILVPTWPYSMNSLRSIEFRFPRATVLIGPNFTFELSDLEEYLRHSSINLRLLLPSEALKSFFDSKYNHLVKTKNAFRAFPSTVDTEFWSPKRFQRQNILVYRKGEQSIEDDCLVELIRGKFKDSAMELQYGNYTRREYLEALTRSRACVYLGITESQGLAQLESWATDVPTFVRVPEQYEKNIEFDDLDYGYEIKHYSPYLSCKTGAFFHSPEELFDLLDMENALFSPRAWVLENLSAHKLIEVLEHTLH